MRHPTDPCPPPGPGLPGLSRRALLGAVGGTALLAAPPAEAAGLTRTGLPLLEPLPKGAPDRTLFAPEEQRFAPYLVILAPMANEIEDTDPATYGWFTGGWWRTPNVPYNARIQEHVYTLSWFHAHPRPWNPYAGDPALLARLDAALQHYLRLQHDDGSWPEYRPTEHSRAATGFGLGYLSKTLQNLRTTGALPTRQAEIRTALRKAMQWFLDPGNITVWESPLKYANQHIAGLAGAALCLDLDPEPALRERLVERIAFVVAHGQSPHGFFYEPRGMDVGYNFEVMLPDMAEIHHLMDEPAMLSMARGFAPWLSYNLVREPDGSGWFTNVAASARTSIRALDDEIREPDRTHLGSLFVPGAPGLAPFFTTREDRAAARAAWAADPAPVPALQRGNTSPRIIAHVPYGEAFPTRAHKQAAIAELPCLQRDTFVELRRDGGQEFLFVRRPGLYLGAFFGHRATPLVRSGLSFLWHPDAGMVVYSLNGDAGCWATQLADGRLDADGNLAAEYVAGAHARPRSGEDPSSDAPFGVRYRTPDSAITTEVTVTRQTVRRVVTTGSAATELIPLVVHPADGVTFTDGTSASYGSATTATADGLTLRRGRTTVQIRWAAVRTASLTAMPTTYLRGGARRAHLLRIPHDGTLHLTVGFG
ncbi:hypothetical protein HW130_04660 [Streptomyces sp. PKU-EA00015]|uniref:hypothetical protein n=1 Tax=Streptomyces sp. PKU-EA00015 TaxID=2748326 RepID=UPI0015A02438|nr:hypothetical protein [Streptomyces sp. PKU-EA00015]NWF25560.1 hypothetical protein [Streptomyces sp. PKU-EA00015]